MTPTHTFKVNETAVNLQIYGGITIGIVFLLLIMAYPQMPAYHLGTITLLIVLGVWNASRRPVKLYGDHMEVKLAPLSGLRMIRYRDITHVNNSHANRLLISFREGGQEKMLKVPWSALEKRAKSALVPLLRNKRSSQKDRSETVIAP